MASPAQTLIPETTLWAHSALGDVNNAKNLADEARLALEADNLPLARFQLIKIGELCDEAVKKIQLALR